MKKRIHLIVPDRFEKPLGGMGVGSFQLIERLKEDYDFNVIGFPEENKVPHYSGVSNPLPAIEHVSVVTLTGQISYFAASASLPKPDIIHAYDWSCYLGAVYAAKHFNVPLVVSMRLSINLLSEMGISYVANPKTVDGHWINRGLCEMELLGLRQATHITQVSKAYAKKFEQIAGLREKTTVVPNGIDLKVWEKFEKVKLPGTQKRKVVYIGRFAAMKGVAPLIEARIPENIDLIFIGEGSSADKGLYENMLQKVKNNSNVHFIGPVYGQEKINVLNSVDAVIMPSFHEPFGIVALEALASKNVLLSSFVDGMSDFLTPDIAINCGVTKDSIERALQAFAVMSDEEIQKRVLKGLDICKEYTWDNAAEKLKAVYELF